MNYFDKMVTNIDSKDLDAIDDWLHPDFLFCAVLDLMVDQHLEFLDKIRDSHHSDGGNS